jgi:hypothetical protein
MRLEIARVLGSGRAAPLLLGCVQALGACTANVDIFRSIEGSRAGAVDAGPSNSTTNSTRNNTSNSTNILVMPGVTVANADGSCLPGHYVGTFNGTYNSAAWGNGSLPLSIAATPSMGRPGLEFWLEQVPRSCRSDQEFCADFTVKGGKIRGYANPFSDGNASAGSAAADPAFVAVRLEIDFGGDLDCSRGLFRGLLQNGCYDVATILFRFNGTAPANYDATNASFTNGAWMVKELASTGAWFPPDSNIGGMGSWQASLANDAEGPAADSPGLCDM